ncbi:MAG: hypothetical protein JST46_01690 [Bacteroidetes bacterium]|nr:hypothetical protein [Bacteroidota bacterium]
MIRALKKIQTIYFCVIRINWIEFIRLYDSRSKVVLWYYPFVRRKFFMQSVERDFAFANAFIQLGVPFRVYLGRKVGKFHNHHIFFSVTKFYDPFAFDNYAQILHHVSKQLEAQGNKVYPTSHETLFWENKAYMHRQFDLLGIKSPRTKIIQSLNDLSEIDSLSFPLLVKEPHSSSSMGLHKVSSEEELRRVIEDNGLFSRSEFLLIQELIDMRKDLRITVVGSKICHHYWRINLQNDWRPTATGFGSKVDFEFLPDYLPQWISSITAKLDLTTAGFDLTWQHDDISGEPIVLEVSPFYQPNPPVDLGKLPYTYGAYKKKLLIRNSWDKRFVDIVFDLQLETVKYFFGKFPLCL